MVLVMHLCTCNVMDHVAIAHQDVDKGQLWQEDYSTVLLRLFAACQDITAVPRRVAKHQCNSVVCTAAVHE